MTNRRPSWKERTEPMYPEDKPRGVCRWCGGPLGKYRREWCGDECALIGGWWTWFTTITNSSSSWQRTRERVLWRDNYECRWCGKADGESDRFAYLEAHHITPRSEGGTDGDDNLITLCQACHDKPEAHPNLHHRAMARVHGERSQGVLEGMET